MVKLEIFQNHISYTNVYPKVDGGINYFQSSLLQKLGKIEKKTFLAKFLKQHMFLLGSKIPSHPPISHLERCFSPAPKTRRFRRSL